MSDPQRPNHRQPERFRIESTETRHFLRLTVENLTLDDEEGRITLSFDAELASPVSGSIALLQVEVARRLSAGVGRYLRSLEALLAGAYPSNDLIPPAGSP